VCNTDTEEEYTSDCIKDLQKMKIIKQREIVLKAIYKKPTEKHGQDFVNKIAPTDQQR
jgi:hypothetical protein